jgi:digeranylgeranylglycerophospholipid reductase
VLYDRPGLARPVEYLDAFVAARFPGARVLETTVGGVPLRGRIPELSTGGLVLVGDAGRLTDPVTGEGILNGMISGRIAGETIAGCIERGDMSASAMRQYDREIDRVLGPALERNYALKEFVRKASDRRLGLAFRAAKAMGAEKFTASRIIDEIFEPRSRRATGLLRMFT